MSELYFPEETSTGYFLTKIAEGLARTDHVEVLCSQPTYSSKGMLAPTSELRNDVHIRRCVGTRLDKNKLVAKLVNAVTISCSIFLAALARVRRGDVVIVVTNPPLLPYLMAAVCGIRRARSVLLVHDVYPDVLVAGGLVSPGSRVVRLLGWLATRLYRRVDRIVVLGEDMRELVVARLAHDADKVQVIRNWADTSEITAVACEQTMLFASLHLSAKFVVQFAGNMGRTHDLRSLAAAAERLQDVPDVHFLLMGWGARRGWLEARVQDAGMRNVSILPHQPRARLADALNACDLAVVPMVEGMKGLSVPSRMYNIMAAGKPILAIAESGSELAATILEEDIGWVVEPGRVDRLVEAIKEAREDRDRLGAMGRRARAVAERKFTYDSAVAGYSRLVHELTGAEHTHD